MPGIGANNVKAIIRAILTRWTMHYQSYRRLRELRTTITMVVDMDEAQPETLRRVIAGDARSKTKAREMIRLIKDLHFWHALALYVNFRNFRDRMANRHHAGWNAILNRLLSPQTLPRQRIAAWTLSF